MVPLVGANTEFEARVLVAKLGSAGILAEVRGLSLPYPRLGTAEVWVEDSACDDARELIAAEEVFPTFAADDIEPESGGTHSPRARWWIRPLLVAVALLLIGSFGLASRCAPAPVARSAPAPTR